MRLYNPRSCIAVLLLLSMMMCSGCLFGRYQHIPDRYPVYQLPKKAKLEIVNMQELNKLKPEVLEKILNTVARLKGENAFLRTTLESYNDYATMKNAVYDSHFKPKKAWWKIWGNEDAANSTSRRHE